MTSSHKPDISEARIYEAVLRKRLSAFIRKSFATVDPGAVYQHNWHIDLIAEYLEACTNGEIKRLIINIPPRMMKSISVAVAWPAWLLGHNPSEQILSASYSQTLSVKHSLDCRAVMQSPWYKSLFPDTRFAIDQNQKTDFQTTKRGHRLAVSTASSATGLGGNFLLCDDPHSAQHAVSKVRREEAIDWFSRSYSSRMNDKKKGCFVIVMQRLHEQDLTGVLLRQGGWDHLEIPMIAPENRFYELGRISKRVTKGELLHPDHRSQEDVAQDKIQMGEFVFSAQYQQRPVPEGGGIIKQSWLQEYNRLPDNLRIFQSWDTAIKAKETSDYSVCTTWGVADGSIYLIDMLRRKLEFPLLKKMAVELWREHSPESILIEDKGSGQSLIQDLRREKVMPLIAINPVNDKVIRTMAASSIIEGGHVYLPSDKLWLADYVYELTAFPRAPHDDIVDSTTQFLNWYKKPVAQPRVRIL